MRIELATSSLPRKCSTTELQRLVKEFYFLNNQSGRRGSNPRPAAWKAAALPTELLPQKISFNLILLNKEIKWGEKDSNLRTRERTDLQSVVVGHLTISPSYKGEFLKKPEPEDGFEPPTC